MATDLETASAAAAEQYDLLSNAGLGSVVVLHGVPWKIYRRLREMPENNNIRMTYDRGELEIMSPSAEHEGIAYLIGKLIDVWTMELNVPIRSCRTMTIRRSALDCGFEPDNCYYVQHEPQMWNKKNIRFTTDPPPDLAVEVETTRSLLNKMEVYAAFGVPELWRWRGNALTVLALSPEGQYVARPTSICFPAFPIARTEDIVRQVGAAHETDLILAFRDWVRENVHS